MRKDFIIIKIAIVALYAAFIVFLCLCAGEIYARHSMREPYLSGLKRSNPIFHHFPSPYFKSVMRSPGDFDETFVTNNRGMRGPGNYVYDKPEGVFRIATLGDSFVFGVGVKANETASAVLESLLDKKGPERYEVYNFGVYSYSPVTEYIYLKKEVIKYKPDLVILMLDPGDIQDDWFYEPHLVYDAKGEIAGCDPFRINGKPDIRGLCMKWSRLCFLLDQKLFQSIRKMKMLGFMNYLTNKSRGIRNKTEILVNKDIDNISFDRLIMFREGKDEKIVMRHWQRTAKYINMIKDYLRDHKIRFILAAYPYGYQVGENQWSKGRTYWAFEQNKRYDANTGFSIISDFAKENNIDFINLCDPLIKANKELLYFSSDGHLTKRGQEVVADAIFNSDVFRKNLE